MMRRERDSVCPMHLCLCIEGGVESRESWQGENVEGKRAFEMLLGQITLRLTRKGLLIGMNKMPLVNQLT